MVGIVRDWERREGWGRLGFESESECEWEWLMNDKKLKTHNRKWTVRNKRITRIDDVARSGVW
ncbi:hypothetical protein SESBI_24790 [Sesbania bispinosa]|nr:hypothetical protein SESBI_24790 [Sesbania bispinosa]